MTALHYNLHGAHSPAPAQKSHANVFPPQGGRARNRAAHRVHVWHDARPAARRPAFAQRWSLLMIASFSSREACAVWADCTFQTACNWFEATHRPYGDVVAKAALTLPRFREIMESP